MITPTTHIRLENKEELTIKEFMERFSLTPEEGNKYILALAIKFRQGHGYPWISNTKRAGDTKRTIYRHELVEIKARREKGEQEPAAVEEVEKAKAPKAEVEIPVLASRKNLEKNLEGPEKGETTAPMLYKMPDGVEYTAAEYMAAFACSRKVARDHLTKDAVSKKQITRKQNLARQGKTGIHAPNAKVYKMPDGALVTTADYARENDISLGHAQKTLKRLAEGKPAEESEEEPEEDEKQYRWKDGSLTTVSEFAKEYNISEGSAKRQLNVIAKELEEEPEPEPEPEEDEEEELSIRKHSAQAGLELEHEPEIEISKSVEEEAKKLVLEALERSDERNDVMREKPPIGLKPEGVFMTERALEILAAMERYILADKPIPDDWFDQLHNISGEV